MAKKEYTTKIFLKKFDADITGDTQIHYKYLDEAMKKIKRSVKYFINKGETDMWHSVKLELRDSKDILSGINLSDGNTHIYYDFHILLDQLEDGDPYEIDVYPVFHKNLTVEYLTNPTYESSYKGLEVDTSELLYQYHVPYDLKVFPEKADLREYRVQIVVEEGSVVYVKAKDEEHAEKLAHDIANEYAGSEYPDEYGSKCVHREFFTQQAEEVK